VDALRVWPCGPWGGGNNGSDPAAHRERLAERFHTRLRRREQALHAALRRGFLHTALRVAQSDLADSDEDLFATSTWTRLGLTRTQLALTGAATGAVLGGTIDLATGGASLFTGATLGGALGLISTLAAWNQLASVRILGSSLGGKLLRMGPVRDPNFAWIVLDRAFLFFAEVANHPHAQREPVELAQRESIVQSLSGTRRKPLDRLFARLRRDAEDRSACAAIRQELVPLLEAYLRELAHYRS